MNKLNIIYKKVEDLIPYEKNPRNNDDAVRYVKESIKQFGFKVPIVVDKDNIVIAGHTRLKASKELGIDEVPVIIADDLTKDQVKAFRLADNKVSEQATWNFDLLNTELDDIDMNMEDFGFIESEIDWASVDDITEENYEEPKENMIECPKCGHKDKTIFFKKVQ